MAAFTCMVRPGDALFTVPNAADVNVVLGAPQRTKLNGLDASTLSSNLNFSLIGKTRPILRFSSLNQKPRTQLRFGFRFPKLKPVLVVKAAAFKNFLDGLKSPGEVTRYGETPVTALPHWVYPIA